MTHGLPERIRTLELVAEHWPAVNDRDRRRRGAGPGAGAGRRRRRHHAAAVRWPGTSPSTGRPTTPRSRRSTGPPRRRSSTGWPRARPHHRLLGEELGTAGDATSPWQWIIDPIDGTSGYVRGIPVWATLIALAHADDGVVVGVVSAPALGRRWWASQGGGTFADGRRCRVSDVDRHRRRPGQRDVQRRLGRARADAGARRPGPGRPPGPRLRRLLAARPRRRGRPRRGRRRRRRRAPTTSPPCASSSRRPAARSPTATASSPTSSDTAISTNGLLHAEVLRRLTTPRLRLSGRSVSTVRAPAAGGRPRGGRRRR